LLSRTPYWAMSNNCKGNSRPEKRKRRKVEKFSDRGKNEQWRSCGGVRKETGTGGNEAKIFRGKKNGRKENVAADVSTKT